MQYLKHENLLKNANFMCHYYSTINMSKPTNLGAVLGVYNLPDGQNELTETGKNFSNATDGLITHLLEQAPIKQGEARIYSNVPNNQNFQHIAITGLGPKNPNKLNLREQLNEEKENIRVAMAAGARACQDEGANNILIDCATVPEAAAEGSILGTYMYETFKTGATSSANPRIRPMPGTVDLMSWKSGEINADAQNWARYLSMLPSNLKKPDILAATLIEKLCTYDVTVKVHNKDWMLRKNMHTSLYVTRGSCQPPLLLDISYCGDDAHVRPIALVGKCNICNVGGLYMKPGEEVHEFRADMAGSAAICAAFVACAQKRLPINMRAVILIYQNIPTPLSPRPGDIVQNKNGKHICISAPSKVCPVVFSDILDFTHAFSPILIIDVGTFTKSVSDMLGIAASGVFTSDKYLYNELQRAALESGDRVWRLPLWDYYMEQNRSNTSADISNEGGEGDTCLAAAFLKVFLPVDEFAERHSSVAFIHIDCFGTGMLNQMEDKFEPYYRKGIKMGRPTRLLIQFLLHRACFLPRPKNSKI